MLRCTIKPATAGLPAILYSGDSGMAGLFHCKQFSILTKRQLCPKRYVARNAS
jgi:hypothetical protein